jgi:ABC-type branched-subunit amino acid transport system substrate-binding protein
MISPCATNPALTTAPEMRPSGSRSFARVIVTDDGQAEADAILARGLHVAKPFVLYENWGPGSYSESMRSAFVKAAPEQGLHVAGQAAWDLGRA